MAMVKRKPVPADVAKYMGRSEKLLDSIILRTGMGHIRWGPMERLFYGRDEKTPQMKVYRRLLSAAQAMGTHLYDLDAFAEGRFEPRAQGIAKRAMHAGSGGVAPSPDDAAVRQLKERLAEKRESIHKDISLLREELEERFENVTKTAIRAQGGEVPSADMLARDFKSIGRTSGKVAALLNKHPELRKAHEAYLMKKVRLVRE